MSNPVIAQLSQRRCVRNFSGESVKPEDLDLIQRTAQQAPTSINGQQITLIVTRDKATIRRIAEIAGGQPQVATADVFITLVMDFNRTREAVSLGGQEQVIERSAEGLMVGAIDAGIMLNAIQTAAASLGYGTTPIGAVRRDPQAMIELLKLPKGTFAVVGTTIGVPDKGKMAQVKPRVPFASFALQEVYDAKLVSEGVRSYDKTLRQWWDAQGMTEMPSYARATADYYKQVYFPKVAASLRSQGFEFSDTV